MIKSDTIAAIATGLTSSGIGIVRISGADASRIASLIFKTKSGKSFDSFESHRAYYGFIYDVEKTNIDGGDCKNTSDNVIDNINDNIIDEALVLFFKGPRSFTTEDTVEINCHGGILVMNKILNVCIKCGARLAEPGEFTKRAFLNGRIDLSEAEAVLEIINSGNDYILNNSVRNLRGKLSDKINELRDKLLHETAFIEAALDDPEHYSLDGYPEKLKQIFTYIIEDTEKLIHSFNDGKVISEGIDTVIIGKPNVGKSSLLNCLTGENRAIVTEIAGTTRDILTEHIMLDGISLNIVDTAGIRDTDDTVEKIGVEKAYKYADRANLVILIIDASVKIDDEDIKLLEYIKDKKAVILLNKSDLENVVNREDIRKCFENICNKSFLDNGGEENLKDLKNIDGFGGSGEVIYKEIIEVSAKEETGIDELGAFIKREFLSGNIDNNEAVIITDIRNKNLLEEARDSLNNVIMSIDNGMPEDFFTIDMVNAYECLGYIIGESISDDVINEVFSKFCMGK